jgi:hypothetical protein
MKTNKLQLIIVTALLLITAACTASFTKSGYISNYEAWISKLRLGNKDYREGDWLQAAIEFKGFSEIQYNQFKEDLTEDELIKVDRLTGEYYGILAKHKANQVKDALESVVNNAQGMLDELKRIDTINKR